MCNKYVIMIKIDKGFGDAKSTVTVDRQHRKKKVL